MAEVEQTVLFEDLEWWRKEWQGMPEFVQEDLSPFKSIYVHFASVQDMLAFAKLVEQTITSQTQSVWYPRAEIETYSDKKYIDEP